ncbi:hypothetical protein ILUMI_24254 [Ignelater luminosus]|uniref:Uncharacterized protein n=1 Tax=Ignelater luminosus TaxID=2038154 RepID=A0A8K0G159_IGNLU|nr:hypothetical protein ILUMI_24254 [Ignelater luminosus]
MSATLDTQFTSLPIGTIFRKSDVPCRLQRMLLKFQAFDVNVTYKSGKLMFAADTLNRTTSPDMESDVDEELRIHVNLFTTHLTISLQCLKQFQEAIIKGKWWMDINDKCYIMNSGEDDHDENDDKNVDSNGQWTTEDGGWDIEKDSCDLDTLEKKSRKCEIESLDYWLYKDE